MIDHWDMAAILALGYLPGIVLNLVVWRLARRNAGMPLFPADIYGLALPLVVWMVMIKYHWTLVEVSDKTWGGVMLLGWIWGVLFLARLLVPCFTHKLRFRLAAIHVGSLTIAAAVLLALFFRGF